VPGPLNAIPPRSTGRAPAVLALLCAFGAGVVLVRAYTAASDRVAATPQPTTGAAVTVPKRAATPPPARIVSLAPSVTETLFALGAGPRVVAVSSLCDYPPEVAALPKIGSFLTPNVEAIIALRPDVVIGTPTPGNRDAVMALRRLGIRVAIVDSTHLADLPRATRDIAAAAGVAEAGERLVAEIDRDMEAVRARVAGVPLRRALMVVGHEPLIAVGPRSFLGELLEAARATNIAPASGPWPHLSIEHVIAADPEVIIDSSMGSEDGTAPEGFWSPFASLAAVRDGRVYAFRSDRVLRPGPRLPAAFADLARLIHPEPWR
jgi:iron complex transport system substrate-binding protein